MLNFSSFNTEKWKKSAMPQISKGERAGQNDGLQRFSCFTCRQRKVKCDRHNPCSNCVKAATQCSFIPPVRGKREKRKIPKEGLHAKLKRYEEMLKSYGVEIGPSDNDNNSSGVETMYEPDAEMAEDAEPPKRSDSGPVVFDEREETKTRFISKNGSSRYFENDRWSNLRKEFRHPVEEGLSDSMEGSVVQGSEFSVDAHEENGLVLGVLSNIEDLASFHPPFHILQKMMDIYTDRVDPMLKLLHLPTFWPMLTSVLQNPHAISKSLEALTFTFYVVTIISLEDNECYQLLGEEKQILSARYRRAARHALIKADFLQTSSLMTLQAFVIYLIGMENHCQGDSLLIMSGIAVRLARRMGLHRDGTSLGLTPFETEMRRRLWCYIVFFDGHTSDSSGAKASMDIFLSDTKMPLNVEDQDLSPEMVTPPQERTGITSIVLSLLRCDVANFLRKITPQFLYDVRWDNLTRNSITLAEKEDMINQMEDEFETKYLRYYEPTNSLHHFLSFMVRSSICKMKLFAHNPRQFANCGVKVPQGSRDIIFANGIKLLENVSLIRDNQSLRKFTWQGTTSYLSDPLLYVLIETRHRKTGPEVDRTWQLIGELFANFPEIFAEASEILYVALSKCVVQVWNDCVAARKLEGLPELPTPEYITAIRRRGRLSSDFIYKPNSQLDLGKAIENPTGYGDIQSSRYNGSFNTDLEPLDSYDFSNLLSFDLEPSEWLQWERLLAGKSV